MDLFSRKAKYEEVKTNREAVEFHFRRFERGQRDTLARDCYQHIMLERNRIAGNSKP